MNKGTLAILFCFSIVQSFSQGINNIWILGYDSVAGVQTGRTTFDFSSGSLSMLWSQRPMNFYASNAVISDSAGNLLFYTNGVWIANANDGLLLNGDGLNPSAYTQQQESQNEGLSISQSDLIIPIPGDNSKYYLFHVTVDSASIIPTYLYYTIVDMTLDGGLGGVVSKNNVLLHSAFYFGGLTSCKHANGRDWWLITHENESSCYVKFLITPYGISGPYYQCIGNHVDLWANSGNRQVVFSPDGKWFAYYDFLSELNLFQFDRCTGDFGNLVQIALNDSAYLGGAAFSPNSKLLYLSSESYVYQFRLDTIDIPASQKTVAVWDSFASPSPPFYATFYLSQLAPDGKIYINTGNGTDYFHVINSPDSIGIACDVCQHCIQLFSYNTLTIPNYPNYFLGVDTTSGICDSLNSGNTYHVEVDEQFVVFPNPATKLLYAAIPYHLPVRSVSLFNVFGQKIEANYLFIKNNAYLEVSTEALPSGIYFLELMNEKQKVVKRFIKE